MRGNDCSEPGHNSLNFDEAGRTPVRKFLSPFSHIKCIECKVSSHIESHPYIRLLDRSDHSIVNQRKNGSHIPLRLRVRRNATGYNTTSIYDPAVT